MRKFVPVSLQNNTRHSLPWMNDKCKAAIRAKHDAEGSANYAAEMITCQRILHEE